MIHHRNKKQLTIINCCRRYYGGQTQPLLTVAAEKVFIHQKRILRLNSSHQAGMPIIGPLTAKLSHERGKENLRGEISDSTNTGVPQ